LGYIIIHRASRPAIRLASKALICSIIFLVSLHTVSFLVSIPMSIFTRPLPGLPKRFTPGFGQWAPFGDFIFNVFYILLAIGAYLPAGTI
jgi:hypothetical protein